MLDRTVPHPPAHWIDMGPGVRRRTLASGEKMMQMAVTFESAASLPEHHHPHEQVTYVVSGRLRLVLNGGGEAHELTAGQSFYLAPDVPHAAEALEDTVVLDTFSPPREDLLARDREHMASFTPTAADRNSARTQRG